LESLSRFATPDGQFRETAFALHAAVRPWLWSKLIALGRDSGTALAAMTAVIEKELELYRKKG
jgi:adenosylhomocysteine nucleosidase